ncbi:hypothetical protein V5O48_006205 [Marasmius crinis-equi]|uniref:Uncharacterized protein n=1 Tax=Marasmius crinis-equi TaxID=585013 RepID=A0ABR3FK70_9AGAR
MTSSDSKQVKLPGFGLPVNALSERCLDGYQPMLSKRLRFPNAITDWSATNLLVRERTMLELINEITDKPEWDAKVHDGTVVAKWKKEAVEREGVDISDMMFDYCIAELRDKAPHFSATGRVTILDSEAAVVKSDSAIPASIADELKAAVKPLEDVPEGLKDWHLGSNKKILDLVCPSLYPLMYGQSRVLPSGRIALADCLESCGKGVVIPKPTSKELDLGRNNTHLHSGMSRPLENLIIRSQSEVEVPGYWSGDYQWLPCEVAIRGDEEVEITSYINNLHPRRHAALYRVLEKIIARTIPLWDDCLSYFGFDDSRHRVYCTGDGPQYEYPLGEERPVGSDEENEEDDERDEQWRRDNRVLVQPEPEEYEPCDPAVLRHVNLRKDWKGEGLQINVKLTNIELRPGDTESFEGGSWQVEGQLNEHICASAVYCYEQSNVTESRLAFRQLTNPQDLQEMDPPEDDIGGIETLFGIRQHGPCVQTLGSVVMKEGRLLVFPNVLQYQVQPFELADRTKPGYRKILAIYLVDPYIRTLSTANVPPQQSDWWAEGFRKDASTRLSRLPVELMDKVVQMTDEWPISLGEAKKIKKDLLSRRGKYVDRVNRDYEQPGFSFSEF